MTPMQIEITKELTLATVEKMKQEPEVSREEIIHEMNKVFQHICQAVAIEHQR